MLDWLLLGVFALTCGLLLKDGFQKPASLFEFPFLAGVGVSSFLLLQAIGVVSSGDIAPSSGVCKALLMSSLCSLAVYCGWHSRPSHPVKLRAPVASTKSLYGLGLTLLAVGFWGMVKLGSLSGGVIAHYSVGGSYALQWRGLPVIYGFFARYLEPGIVLCSLTALRLRSEARLLPVLGAFAFVLADVLLLGRRTPFAFLLITLGLLAYFGRRWAPPRPVVIVGACLAGISVFVIPYYRLHSQLGGDREAIADIRPREILRHVLEASGEEFPAAAYLIQITEEERIFQYGVGFYNSFVRYFVPKVLVGESGKARLLIDLPDAGHVGPQAGSVPNQYGWTIEPTIVPTGPASAFQQFWYLGCGCFYVLARWLKRRWVSAVAGDLWSQIVYAVCATYAVAAVMNDIYAIYIPVFCFVLPAATLMRLWATLHSASHRGGGLRRRMFPRAVPGIAE